MNIALPRRIKAAIRAFTDLTGPVDGGPYRGTDINRLTADWIAPLLTADDVVRSGMVRLRARARDLVRNNAYAKQYMNLLNVNVIGPHGFGHQAQVRNNSGDLAKTLNETLEDAFSDWSASCTRDGKLSLLGLEHLLLQNAARDGECFVRVWIDPTVKYGIRLEPMQSELVDETMWRRASDPGNGMPHINEIRMGVEVDEKNASVAYYCWNSLTEPVSNRVRNRIPAAEIVHLYLPDSANQTRGVPWLAPVMTALHMLDSYEQAELVAARVGACQMGFLQNKEGMGSEYSAPDNVQKEIDAQPASVEQLAPGYEFKEWNPSHPSTAYGPFVKGALRRIASGLGISYNALANDLEGVNFSSMRSGLLIERDLWKTLQRWWLDAFHHPIYLLWLRVAITSGDLRLDSRDPSKFEAVRWSPRGWPWVDPHKDVQAAVMEIQNGLGSRTTYATEHGQDIEDIIDDLAEEEKLAKAANVVVVTAPLTVGAGGQGGGTGATASLNGASHRLTEVLEEVE